MARIEAPAGAKAAGNSYSPEPVVTAPVVDSTGLGRNHLPRFYDLCRTTADSPGEPPGLSKLLGTAPSATQRSWINPQKARYYQVFLDQDLFGDWTLVPRPGAASVAASSSGKTKLDLEELTGTGSEYDLSDQREDVAERSDTRSDGLDSDEARWEAETELWESTLPALP